VLFLLLLGFADVCSLPEADAVAARLVGIKSGNGQVGQAVEKISKSSITAVKGEAC
jgi:hypothetical protein